MAVIALLGGATVTQISTAYLAGFLSLTLVVAIFLWRSQEPMVPFLLLVAAIQGGILLELPLGDAPIQGLLPFLGGWTLLAVLIRPKSGHLALPSASSGRLLPASLIVLCAIVALTALIQNWRPGGRLPDLSEWLTLVQQAVLVLLAGYLLWTPRRVMMVVYVTIVSGVLAALVALADQAGLLNLGTDMDYAGNYTRVSGLLDDPNYFSYQLLVALAFAVHVASAARSNLTRALMWLAFGIIAAGIVSSYSAGALVGVGAVIGVAIILQYRVSAKRALAAVVLIAVVTGVVAATAPPGYGQVVKEKYGAITTSSFEQLGTKRGAAWEAGIRQTLANPVMGTGLTPESQVSAIADYYTYSSRSRIAAHNMYIGMAVGTGVPGLVAFLVVMASCFSILWTAHSKATRAGHSEAVLAAACVFTALAVVATQGLSLDTQFTKYTWLLVGVCLGIRRWDLGRVSTTGVDSPHLGTSSASLRTADKTRERR